MRLLWVACKQHEVQLVGKYDSLEIPFQSKVLELYLYRSKSSPRQSPSGSLDQRTESEEQGYWQEWRH